MAVLESLVRIASACGSGRGSLMAVAAFFLFLSAAAAEPQPFDLTPKYSRADCTVHVLAQEPADKGEEFPSLGTFTEFIMKYTVENNMPFSFGGHGEVRLSLDTYFAYYTNCDEKFAFTEKMFDDFLAANPGYFDWMHVSRERVEPGPYTYNPCGIWWTDCQEMMKQVPR